MSTDPASAALADPTNVWTAQSVIEHATAAPNTNWATETGDAYKDRYVRPVEQFGLTIRLDPIATPNSELLVDLMPVKAVPVRLIRSSTQVEGVCLDIIDHYLRRPDDLFDLDGWFGNVIPVMFLRPDGTYTVRDGNHRSIAAMLRGDEFIDAHVVQ